MARFSSYDGQKTIDKAIEYLEDCPDTIPSIVGLAIHIGVTSRTLQNWAKDEDKEEFFRTLEYVKDHQHRLALNNGLNGEFNSVITKLVLANHGYREKQEVEAKVDATIEATSNISLSMSQAEATQLYQELLDA